MINQVVAVIVIAIVILVKDVRQPGKNKIYQLTATSYNREPNFPILKKIRIPDYDAILKGPTQLEKPPKDFWLGCPWAGLRPKTRVTQILVLKLKNALPKPYDEQVKKILYQNYDPQMVV